MSKSAKFCIDFLSKFLLSRSGFKTEQHVDNLKLLPGAPLTFFLTLTFSVLSKLGDFATFKKVEVHAKNSTF